MHKCIVCFNCSSRTKYSRPEVIYHSFPKNEFRRRIWLKVFGIAECFDWHRICSDHFLDTDYKPGGKRYLLQNTVPQPYIPNYNEDNFSNNTQSDGRPTDNESLPVSQNISIAAQIDETVETVVNNFESPRRSSRKIKLTTTNEDMSYENMPRLQTEQFERRVSTYIPNNRANGNNESVLTPIVPAYTDHSLGSGIRCSIKSCNNRYSKHLSFFGYPKDPEIRKLWIVKCGLQDLDPTKKLKSSLKVCRKHFEDDCFLNTAKMNRLKSDAVPTLFLDNDITDERNIPSTSSSVNNGFNFVDKPSCSSSNYSTNEETNKSHLAYVSETVTCFSKDINCLECCVPGCITSNENTIHSDDEFISLFKPPTESINDWSSILGIPLTENSIVCGNHFRSQDVISSRLKINGKDQVIKTLAINALPLQVNANAMQSATTTNLLETNAGPVLKTYQGYKRSRINKNEEHLSAKKIRNNFKKKSNSTAESIFVSEKLNNMFASDSNDINKYASTSGLNPTLESNTVKIPPMNTDNFSTSNTSKSCFEESLPKIVANSSRSLSNVEPSTSNQIELIGDIEKTVRHNNTDEYQQPAKQKIVFAYLSNGASYPVIMPPPPPPPPLNPFAIVKVEQPNNDDTSDSLHTNFDQITETQNSMHNNSQANMIQSEQNWNITPKQTIQQSIVNPTCHSIPIIEPINIKCEPVENNDDDVLSPQLTSIDNSSSIELSNIKQKIQKITANNSLSITLERVENTKVTESSDNLLPKSFPKSSMSITLQPKLDNNLSLTNSSPSVTLAPRISSASNSSVCNVSQHSSTQYEQASISTLNVPSSINQHRPIKNKILKAIPTAQKKMIPKPSELKIHDYYSLESMPNDFNTNASAYIINKNNYEENQKVEQKDNGFIHEVSKNMTLPSIYWITLHDVNQNLTIFVQRNDFNDSVKKINFYNSLMPVIQIYGKKYEYNTPIKTKIELETLLEKIDNFEKCSGHDGFTHEKCIGYFEAGSEDIEMCSACQQLIRDQDLHKTKTSIESKSKTIANLKNKISERKIRVCEARKKLEKKRNSRMIGALYPSGISNVMKPHQ